MKNSLKLLIVGFISVIVFDSVFSQGYSRWDNKQLVIDNGVIKRTLNLSETGGFSTTSILLSGYKQNFVSKSSEEFSFLLNDKLYNGSEGWNAKNYHSDGKGSSTVTLGGLTEEIKNLEIDITYTLYPGLPVIRKKMAFRNLGTTDMKIEGVIIEKLTTPTNLLQALTYNNFARDKWYGQLFRGSYNDPLVAVQNLQRKDGVVLGNESPGMLKETTVLQQDGLVTIGLTQPGETYSFQKWLRHAEEWESPWVFIIPYYGAGDPFKVINLTVNDFVRKYMGIRLSGIPVKPCFVYNTWKPFRTSINDTLIMKLADAASECGVEEFVIDDGWQNNRGDWEIDRKKFPNGLKPVFDHIKSKGMKPGLWISIASVSPESNVYKGHPEWLIRSQAGKPFYLHNDNDRTMTGANNYSMSLGTAWYDYIKNKILYLVREHGLEYLKADLAVVNGAYTYNKTRSGDYSTTNPLYRTREESLLVLYRKLWQLFDDLHKEAPKLFIDCTFETVGSLHLIDYDMCKHAEGDWLSNIEDPFPTGALRVRRLAWARTPVIPSTSLVIGNLGLNGPEGISNLKSLIGTLPIVLGDLREIAPEQKSAIRKWADWLKKMQKEYSFLMYRQDLPGFGEPAEGSWDGWSRINTDTGTGGIVGVFRENAVEDERVVSISFLKAESRYEVRNAPEGQIIHVMTGKELRDKGFKVSIDANTGSQFFEIRKVAL